MNNFNPLEKRLQDNEAKQSLKLAVYSVAAMLGVLLLIVLAVFGNDVKDSLAGYQKISDKQTATILKQTNTIQGQNKVIQKQNALIECLVRDLEDCADESQSVDAAQSQQPNPQANPAPTNQGTQGKRGEQGPPGEQGEPGPTCTLNFLGVCL